MIETHEKIKIADFEGLWSRGEFDGVPPEFFRDCLNVSFLDKEVMTRPGLGNPGSDLGGVGYVDIFVGTVTPASGGGITFGIPVQLVFANSDVIANGSAIFTGVFAQNFRGHNAFGKFFFVLSGGVLPNENFFYVWLGSGNARKMGGAKVPEAPAMTIVSSAPGKIERGVHVFRTVFETDSGFVTAPGATVAYTAGPSDKVNLSVIPTGPAGTAKRHIIATRAILNYDGDFANREYFFIPGATLNDNVTTVLANVSFYDADLFESADFTLNQLAEIPSFGDPAQNSTAGGLTSYKNRLVLWTDGTVWVSAPDEPESYDSVSSAIIIDIILYGKITACAEYRGSLYIFTLTKTFITSDNGDDPNTWDVILIDTANGAMDNGVASIYLTKGNTADYLVIRNETGIYKFVGIFADELTNKIKEYYTSNTRLLVPVGADVCIDDYSQRVYTKITTDLLLVGDYSRGLTEADIRWSLWQFTGPNVSSPHSFQIKVFYTGYTVAPAVQVYLTNSAGTSTVPYPLDDTLFSDNGIAINSFIEFDMGPDNEKVNHFAGYQAVATGSGNFTSTVYWDNKARNANLRNIALSSSKKEKFLGFNVVSERLGLRLGTSGIGDWFCFRKLVVYFKELYLRYGN